MKKRQMQLETARAEKDNLQLTALLLQQNASASLTTTSASHNKKKLK